MTQSVKRHNFFLLALILIVGAVLRVYNFTEIPFTHDEFSAYFRTQFDTFSDLIAHGARIDGHPVGIQVFLYYWIYFFGATEWVVKLPFFLFGMGSIYLIYQIGKFWFNSSVGLFSAALMSVSQFPLMYSQIARPYISGLFFSLLMFWFWSKLVKKPNNRFWINGMGFVLGASLCTYNHHFSMLFAFIVGIYGLFLVSRQYIWKYIVLGVLVFILYLPHLEILFHQMSMKGVEGWLAKPDFTFLIQFLGYIFNFSWLFIGVILSVLVFGYFNKSKKILISNYVLFTILFSLPFLIGYFYSVYVSAVLQFSVLIYSYPFLYFILLGHFKAANFKVNLIMILVILFTGSLSLIFERKHYAIFYKDHFEYVLLDFHDAKKWSADLPAYIDSRDGIVEFYADRHELSTDFKYHDDFKSPADVHELIKSSAALQDYFYLGVNSRFDPVILTLVQEYYPHLIFKRDYFIGTHYLFAKFPQKESTNNRDLLNKLDFQNASAERPYWRHIDQERLGSKGYEMDAEIEWSPTFEMEMDSVITHRNDFVELRLEYFADQLITDAQIVLSIDKGDENIYWLSLPLSHLQFKEFDSTDSQKAFATLKCSDIKNFSGANLKAYVWNKGRESFVMKEISIFRNIGNPILYGLFQPI